MDLKNKKDPSISDSRILFQVFSKMFSKPLFLEQASSPNSVAVREETVKQFLSKNIVSLKATDR